MLKTVTLMSSKPQLELGDALETSSIPKQELKSSRALKFVKLNYLSVSIG